MIELKNITKTFGSFKALDGLSMTVPKGAVYGLVGPNGAGKSTAIRCMVGVYRTDSGEIKKLQMLTYIVTLVLAVLVLVLSLNPPAFLQDLVMFAINGFASSFTAPILFGFFWKKSTPAGGMASMIAGFATMIGLNVLPIPTNLLGFNPLIWALVVSSIVMVAVSKCSKQQDEAFLNNLFN